MSLQELVKSIYINVVILESCHDNSAKGKITVMTIMRETTSIAIGNKNVSVLFEDHKNK